MPREWDRPMQWWLEQMTLAQMQWASPDWQMGIDVRPRFRASALRLQRG